MVLLAFLPELTKGPFVPAILVAIFSATSPRALAPTSNLACQEIDCLFVYLVSPFCNASRSVSIDATKQYLGYVVVWRIRSVGVTLVHRVKYWTVFL